MSDNSAGMPLNSGIPDAAASLRRRMSLMMAGNRQRGTFSRAMISRTVSARNPSSSSGATGARPNRSIMPWKEPRNQGRKSASVPSQSKMARR